jgi:hypothetical protein
MAQIFKPSSNTVARASLAMAGGGVLILGLAVAAISRSPLNTKVNVPKNQPVPFSHQHHTWELGIDCRYCHTSVEKSAQAGFPATEVCMSCHSQIWQNSPLLEPIRQSYETKTPMKWTLVNKVPEFVYFNHSIHISRGINCNTCHGPVQQMHITWKGNSFQMQWCLECHRSPEKYLYHDESNPQMTPRQQVFNLYWKIQANDPLTEREKALVKGDPIRTEDPVEVKKGLDLVVKYGVKTQELADCSTCHR